MADENPSAKQQPMMEESGEIMNIQRDDEGPGEQSLFDDHINLPLVLDLLIQNTTDVEFLKKCRLLNKYWNIQACGRLQRVSITTLNEDDGRLTRLKEFTRILIDRSFGTMSSLPSPFKDFKVIGRSFSNSCFCNLVLSRTIKATYCNVSSENRHGPDEINKPEITEFLKLNQANMTDLTISSVNSAAMLEIFKGIKFTSVRKLFVEEYCGDPDDDEIGCQHVEALNKALQDSALSTLDIAINSFHCFFSLLTMNLSQVVKLDLEIHSLGYECWDALANLQLPRVKHLTLFCNKTEEGRFSQQLNSFLGNVASSLNTLEHDIIAELETNLVFPELITIELPAPANKKLQNLFPAARFPKLKFVWLHYCSVEGMKFLENDFSPHQGIKEFGISITSEAIDLSHLDSIFPIYLKNLKRLFPNIKQFGIITRRDSWVSSFLQHTHSVFPHLRSIRMRSQCDFQTLAGVTLEHFHDYAKSGMPIQKIPRRISLFDFKDLEDLRLESLSSVSNDLIQYCLSLLPKLKYLRIRWSHCLTIQVFEECFQHLRKLKICKNPSLPKNLLFELKQALPDCDVKLNY